MDDIESSINDLLAKRPDVTRAEIDERIRQKIEKIGAGYLTEGGAIFLVADDLGVKIHKPTGDEMFIKDLHAGAKDVTLKARVLSISSTRPITKKDGTPLLLRSMAVYDNSGTSTVKMWNEIAKLPVFDTLTAGDLVKITAEYVKTDINGDLSINLNADSAVEKLEETSDIRNIDSIAIDVSEVTEGQRDIVVKGRVDGQLSTIEFHDKRGQERSALKMRLKGANGESYQVILWGQDTTAIPKSVPSGATTQLAGVSARVGRSGQVEIHGNEGTTVKMEGDADLKLIMVRIISSGVDRSGHRLILASDKDGHLITLRDMMQKTAPYGEGTIIDCLPSKSFGDYVELDESSYVGEKAEDDSMPTRNSLRTKIKDIQTDRIYCVDVIVLEAPGLRDIATRSGENVPLGEIRVSDDTGMIWIKGWRDRAGPLADLKVGQKVYVAGANAKKGPEGEVELDLLPFSSISPKTP